MSDVITHDALAVECPTCKAKVRAACRRYCVRRSGGRLCVLAAYASGPKGVRGRWYRGPRRVERDAARVRAAMGWHAPAGKAES